jgi:hypothetical protein
MEPNVNYLKLFSNSNYPTKDMDELYPEQNFPIGQVMEYGKL